jgi:prolyl oligopeptidase
MPAELAAIPNVVDTIHGVRVADPYRWLEDRATPQTEEWVARQRTRFEDYVRGLGPLELLRERVKEFVDVEAIDQIGKVQDRYFYRKRSSGDQQPSIFVTESTGNTERVLVPSANQDPYTAIGIYCISADGSLLAYEVKQGGEHSKAINIVDVANGTILPDHLERGLARGLAFSRGNDGFYYCHELLNEPTAQSNTDHAVLFHRLGSSTNDDPTLLRLPRTQSSKLVLTSEGGMLGAIYCRDEAKDSLVDFYVARQGKSESWSCLCKNQPAPFSPFFYRGRIFAHSFQDWPNGEIVELDASSGERSRVIVPEWRVRVKQCALVSDRLYLSYAIGTETVVRIWSLNGEYLGELPLEEGCTWGLVPAYTNEVDELFLHCESYTKPPTLLRYQARTGVRTVWSQRHAPPAAGSFLARKVTYASNDGTEVRMSLIGPEDGSLYEDRPMILTAYGGFGVSMTPQFSTFVSVLLGLGFLFALPEIRGGGERGRDWHEAARRRNRQVGFDDFTAAAEWLCVNGFTSPQKLAIFGGSNSGILVGAALTQRPDLFRAAICVAPLLDMVRYHLFDRASVWADEYGTADDPGDFRALLAYSPYHHVREDTDYPAVLFVCGDRDTRCNPAHARKMAARLEDRPAQKRSILVDHSSERGHAPTMPLSVRLNALTHRIAFLCHELVVSLPSGDAI